jgi:hypothetical protein
MLSYTLQYHTQIFCGFEKCLFVTKTGWKYVFYPCEAYILARLDITVLYIIF